MFFLQLGRISFDDIKFDQVWTAVGNLVMLMEWWNKYGCNSDEKPHILLLELVQLMEANIFTEQQQDS